LKPTDSKGAELKPLHIYRERNGQYFPFEDSFNLRARGKADHLKSNEELKYHNASGVVIRLVVPKIVQEVKEAPPKLEAVHILTMLAIGGRPGVDQEGHITYENVPVPAQFEFIKNHDLTDEEIERFRKAMNYDEGKVRPVLNRVKELLNQDLAKFDRAEIEAKNNANARLFYENLPNVRKFTCGHTFDRRNALDQSRFKKDKEFVYCPHGCKDGKLPLGDLF